MVAHKNVGFFNINVFGIRNDEAAKQRAEHRPKHSSYLPGYVKPCLLVTQKKKALNLRIQNKKKIICYPYAPSYRPLFYN